MIVKERDDSTGFGMNMEMVNLSFSKCDEYANPYDTVHRSNEFETDVRVGFSVTNEKLFEDKHPEMPLTMENSEYQTLPYEYFKYGGVAPPLVSRNWLRSVRDECLNRRSNNFHGTSNSDEEDSLPLSDLKQRFASLQDVSNKLQSSIDSISRFSVQEGDGEKTEYIIRRRRGRPRKQVQPVSETVINSTDSNFSDNGGVNNDTSDNDADWWSNSVDTHDDLMSRDVDAQSSEAPSQEESAVQNSKIEVKIETLKKRSQKVKGNKDISDLKKKAREKNKEVNSIKIDNSKHVYPCLECGKTFSAACTLKYHLRIHNGTLIKCQECGRGFTTNYLLKCHMRIHTGDLFICHKCGRGFTTAELLKVHNRSHTGVRPYPCNICGKFFPSASNLTQHKGTHEAEKKYLCSQCGSSFSQKRTLDGHMLSHGEKNHACTVCGKLWARKSDLREHMRVHTGYKPYACSSCPQKFTQASSLRRHQIIHRDATPVQCLICGKMFKCDEYYKRHVKKHKKSKEGEEYPVYHDFSGS